MQCSADAERIKVIGSYDICSASFVITSKIITKSDINQVSHLCVKKIEAYTESKREIAWVSMNSYDSTL